MIQKMNIDEQDEHKNIVNVAVKKNQRTDYLPTFKSVLNIIVYIYNK